MLCVTATTHTVKQLRCTLHAQCRIVGWMMEVVAWCSWGMFAKGKLLQAREGPEAGMCAVYPGGGAVVHGELSYR